MAADCGRVWMAGAMRRKAGLVAEADGSQPAAGAELSRAWRNSLQKAGVDSAAGLTVRLRECRRERRNLDAVVKAIPDHALIALLEGAGGRFGLAIVNPELTSALVEQHMTGRVAKDAPPPRKPTRADSVLVADFIDSAIEVMEEAGAAFGAAGYRFAHLLGDREAVNFTLAAGDFAVNELDLAVGEDGREAAIALATPETLAQPDVARDEIGIAQWGRALRPAIMGCELVLRADFTTIKLPLSKVRSLAVGDLVELGAADLTQTTLFAQNRAVVAVGRVGRFGVMRAVKLADDDVQSLASATHGDFDGDDGSEARMIEAGAAMTDPEAAFASEPADGPLAAASITDMDEPALPDESGADEDLLAASSSEDAMEDGGDDDLDDLDALLSGGFEAAEIEVAE